MIERQWNADVIANTFGAIFIILGLIGFVPNPLVSETGVFQVNGGHNLVHILTGVILLAGVYYGVPATVIRWIAGLYVVVAILGFLMPGDMLFGLIQLNDADRWLHLGLAAVMLVIGFLTPVTERVRHVGA
jgi:hypothetical protein